ncbi:uncharacterized protein LOC132031291 isoform X2 [Lycium ferocissimum]|uniref:uncharacterized protein LOC132031291 isoform X2 n=1 Tax=Lycium ferocissimum TaxID=112874 RepID=UPI002815BD45|nr:uncharacterized protein LOC132031291 isoform X2 [Lycium ferocissimum]
MVSISSWRSDLVTGVLCPKIDGVYPRLPSRTVSYRRSTLKSHDCVHPMFRKVPGRSITHLSLAGDAVKCASFVERNYQSSVNDDEEPFLINSMKQAIWTAKSILLFLAEQPSQLKYIKWPGFQSTMQYNNRKCSCTFRGTFSQPLQTPQLRAMRWLRVGPRGQGNHGVQWRASMHGDMPEAKSTQCSMYFLLLA